LRLIDTFIWRINIISLTGLIRFNTIFSSFRSGLLFGATLYIYFARIGTSNAAADESQIRSHIKYRIQDYNILMLILYSKLYYKM